MPRTLLRTGSGSATTCARCSSRGTRGRLTCVPGTSISTACPCPTRGWAHRGQVEQRNVLTSAPANYRPVSVYSQIFQHAVETSGVLACGASVITTEGGETLHLPKSTALGTAAIVSEGAVIGESDRPCQRWFLQAFKYGGVLVQASTEMLPGHLGRHGLVPGPGDRSRRRRRPRKPTWCSGMG